MFGMSEIRRTEVYVQWIDGLRDLRARARILARVERLASGNPGDAKPVGKGVSKLRINYGPLDIGCTIKSKQIRSSSC